MNLTLKIVTVLTTMVIPYLLGSINFAIIVTRLFIGKDIRDFGSGNAGMTNVLRTVGVPAAILTLLGDFGKGIASVFLGRLLFEFVAEFSVPLVGAYLGGICVLIGHIYPIFYQFKGGKGVLTIAGIILVIDPRVFLIGISIFLIITLISRYVSLGSIIALATYPIVTCLFNIIDQHSVDAIVWNTVFAVLLGAVSIFMHRANIKRLLNGTENRFGSKKNKPQE